MVYLEPFHRAVHQDTIYLICRNAPFVWSFQEPCIRQYHKKYFFYWKPLSTIRNHIFLCYPSNPTISFQVLSLYVLFFIYEGNLFLYKFSKSIQKLHSHRVCVSFWSIWRESLLQHTQELNKRFPYPQNTSPIVLRWDDSIFFGFLFLVLNYQQ